MSALRHPVLALLVRLALGGFFVAAAIPKLMGPPAFAHNVHMYALVPGNVVNVQAILMPGVEIAAGLALLIGLRPRAAAWVCAFLLALFMTALAINLARENPVICSCFDPTPVVKPCAEQLSEMRMTILRDVGFLLLAAHVIWTGGSRLLAVAPDTER
jgi:putative oxidoreductase